MYQNGQDTTMSTSSSNTGFAIGMLVGAVVGAGVALLFAPKPGKDLRREIGQSMGPIRDEVTRRWHDVSQRASAELENLHSKVDKAAEAVGSTARDVLNSGVSGVQEARSTIRRS